MRDDTPTIGAIAALAFIAADVGHEVVGHGIGFIAAGGHSAILTATRILESQRLGDRGGDLFDLGGPLGNFLFAAIPWLLQRIIRGPAPRLRLLLWLTMAFSLFWAFGYLMFCGIVARGDWFALIRSASHLWLWRALFVAVGFALYRWSERVGASELRWIVSPQSRLRARQIVVVSYLAAGVIGTLGPMLDPKGPMEMLNSGALSSFGAAVGLFYIPRMFSILGERRQEALIVRSKAWIGAAVVAAVWYVGVLGPGIRF
jgi:hypothetical protein